MSSLSGLHLLSISTQSCPASFPIVRLYSDGLALRAQRTAHLAPSSSTCSYLGTVLVAVAVAVATIIVTTRIVIITFSLCLPLPPPPLFHHQPNQPNPPSRSARATFFRHW